VVNRLVRGLLRTPFLCRVVGSRVITIYIVGRKSGGATPVAFIAAQVTVMLVMVVAGDAHAWRAIGHFFITFSAAGLTGLPAALAVVLLAGGYATMRRVTV